MSARTISSQRYLDPAIVAAKRAARDYTAAYVVTEIEGETLRVVTDGHHSIAAAKADGVQVVWEPAHSEVQAEADYLGGTEYLAAHQLDADWYDVATGRDAW